MDNKRMIRMLITCILLVIVCGILGSYWRMSPFRSVDSFIKHQWDIGNISPFEDAFSVNPTTDNQANNGIRNDSLTTPKQPSYATRTHPMQHIAFLKTHKCASSSIQNMLVRYGYTNNLTFAMPSNATSYSLGWPAKFNLRLHMAKFNGIITIPDVFCLHAVYSLDLHNLMPKDTFFVTSVREPISRFISSYVYYGWYQRTQLDAHQLFNAGFQADAQKKRHLRRFQIELGNAMLYDLGLNTVNASRTEIENYIKELDSKFHLVIVVDYYYECMIILRDMLGLTTYDVMTLMNNARKDGSAPPKGVSVSEILKLEDQFRERLSGDFMLYNHFKRKIEGLIERNREYLTAEVHKLKTLAQTWSNFCVKESISNTKINDSRFRPYGNGVYGFVLNPEAMNNQTCLLLGESELHLINVVRGKTNLDPQLTRDNQERH